MAVSTIQCAACGSWYEDLAEWAGCPQGCSKLRPKLTLKERTRIAISKAKDLPAAIMVRKRPRRYQIDGREYACATSIGPIRAVNGTLTGKRQKCVVAAHPTATRGYGIFKPA